MVGHLAPVGWLHRRDGGTQRLLVVGHLAPMGS